MYQPRLNNNGEPLMAPGNPTRLLKLADREFRQLTEDPTAAPPAPRRFKAVRLNVTRFDHSWDRKRGSAARLMAILLREDDTTLQRRVCENDRSAKTYADAVSGYSGNRSIFGRSRVSWTQQPDASPLSWNAASRSTTRSERAARRRALVKQLRDH